MYIRGGDLIYGQVTDNWCGVTANDFLPDDPIPPTSSFRTSFERPCELSLVIPTVVHVIYDGNDFTETEAQIANGATSIIPSRTKVHQMIANLNTNFRRRPATNLNMNHPIDSRIEFRLSTIYEEEDFSSNGDYGVVYHDTRSTDNDTYKLVTLDGVINSIIDDVDCGNKIRDSHYFEGITCLGTNPDTGDYNMLNLLGEAYGWEKHLNIFLMSTVEKDGETACGLSNYRDCSSNRNTPYPLAIIDYHNIGKECIGEVVMAHEIGHTLLLRHTDESGITNTNHCSAFGPYWSASSDPNSYYINDSEDATCLDPLCHYTTNYPPSCAGDWVCDTPPLDCSSPNVSADDPSLCEGMYLHGPHQNFMNICFDSASNLQEDRFTLGQTARMRRNLSMFMGLDNENLGASCAPQTIQSINVTPNFILKGTQPTINIEVIGNGLSPGISFSQAYISSSSDFNFALLSSPMSLLGINSNDLTFFYDSDVDTYDDGFAYIYIQTFFADETNRWDVVSIREIENEYTHEITSDESWTNVQRKITENIVLPASSTPTSAGTTGAAGKTLTIDGCTLEFEPNTGIIVEAGNTLIIRGYKNYPTVLRGELDENTCENLKWNGITIHKGANLVLENMIDGTDQETCEETLILEGGELKYLESAGTHTWNQSSHPWDNATGSATNSLRFNGDIVIPDNANITMNDLHIEFGPNGRIRVEPGATLNINGCTFTGNPTCGTMWQGIQIFSDEDTDPSDPLVMVDSGIQNNLNISNSHIRDAIIGVTALDFDLFRTADITTALASASETDLFQNITPFVIGQIWTDPTIANTAGGSIDIRNTTFEACYHGINLSYYQQQTYRITENTFIGSSDLNAPLSGYTSELGVGGIQPRRCFVDACTFTNLIYGMRVNESSYVLIRDNLDFGNCQVGVSVQAAANYKNSIQTSNFNNCRIAMQCDGSNIRINRNNINTDPSQNYDNSYVTTGICLRGTRFLVGGIIDTWANNIQNVNYGAYLINNDEEGGLIKHNNFDNTNLSIRSEGNNEGVDISCNQFNHYQNAIFAYASITSSSNTLSQQGDCAGNASFDDPAFNLFDNDDATFDIHLDSGQPFFYVDKLSTINTISSNNTEILDFCISSEEINRTTHCNNPSFRLASEIPTIDNTPIKNKETKKLLRKYEDEENTTDAIHLLDAVDTRMTKRLAIDFNLQAADYDRTNELLNTLPQEKLEDQYYRYVYNLLKNLKANGQNIRDITEEQVNQLLTIAESNTKTAYKAQALLYVAKGYEFPFEIPKMEGGDAWYTVFKNATDNSATTLPVIEFSPNPAKNKLQINYTLATNEQANLNLFDINGRLMHFLTVKGQGKQNISVANYPEGLYFYTLEKEGRILHRNKLLIVK